MKTCVLPFSRRNGFECTIRSRSRWNGVRTRHSASGAERPRVSYERTASGESDRSSCSRTRSAKASATLPASSGTLTSVLRSAGVHWGPVLEFAFILAGYVALLFVFRIVGGIGAAADALESWGARASAK